MSRRYRAELKRRITKLCGPEKDNEALRAEWLALEEKYGRLPTQEDADAMTDEEVDAMLTMMASEDPTPLDRLKELQLIFGSLHYPQGYDAPA